MVRTSAVVWKYELDTLEMIPECLSHVATYDNIKKLALSVVQML